MKTVWSRHLVGDIETDTRANQWLMTVSNNGVCIAFDYGSLPIPDDDTIKARIERAAKHLPVNLWSA